MRLTCRLLVFGCTRLCRLFFSELSLNRAYFDCKYYIFVFTLSVPHRDSRFWFQITRNDNEKSPIRFHFTPEMHKNLIFLSILARNWNKMCNFASCFARDIRYSRLYTSNHHLGQESQTPKERRRIVRRRFSDWSGLWWAGSAWKWPAHLYWFKFRLWKQQLLSDKS